MESVCHVVSNGKMTTNYKLEMMWKNKSQSALRYYSGICLDGLRRTM